MMTWDVKERRKTQLQQQQQLTEVIAARYIHEYLHCVREYIQESEMKSKLYSVLNSKLVLH